MLFAKFAKFRMKTQFFSNQAEPKIFFVLHSTYTGDTPYQVWSGPRSAQRSGQWSGQRSVIGSARSGPRSAQMSGRWSGQRSGRGSSRSGQWSEESLFGMAEAGQILFGLANNYVWVWSV